LTVLVSRRGETTSNIGRSAAYQHADHSSSRNVQPEANHQLWDHSGIVDCKYFQQGLDDDESKTSVEDDETMNIVSTTSRIWNGRAIETLEQFQVSSIPGGDEENYRSPTQVVESLEIPSFQNAPRFGDDLQSQ
jgi:hypothetical protein